MIENHVDTAAPIVIEGDGVLPCLYFRSSVRDRARTGQVQAVFLVEPVIFRDSDSKCRCQPGLVKFRRESRSKKYHVSDNFFLPGDSVVH